MKNLRELFDDFRLGEVRLDVVLLGCERVLVDGLESAIREPTLANTLISPYDISSSSSNDLIAFEGAMTGGVEDGVGRVGSEDNSQDMNRQTNRKLTQAEHVRPNQPHASKVQESVLIDRRGVL